MKKILMIVLAAALLLIAGVPAVLTVMNDGIAKDVAEKLEAFPLPEQTELLETVSKAGKLTGNGNGMQYFGAVLLKSALPIDELKDHYSGFSDNGRMSIVEKQNGSQIGLIEHGSLAFETPVEGDGYYIVYSWGSNGGDPLCDLDLRGH